MGSSQTSKNRGYSIFHFLQKVKGGISRLFSVFVIFKNDCVNGKDFFKTFKKRHTIDLNPYLVIITIYIFRKKTT